MSDSELIYDMVFLHPPASFRKIDYPLSGVFESTTGTTDMLTMAPIGMVALANILRSAGFAAKVFNVAKVFLKQRYQPEADVWDFVHAIRARVYGVGLHWSAHAPGALELARRIKERDPDRIVVFGGLTATLYYDELLREYPFIDVVALGEVEHAIEPLLRALFQPCPDLSLLANIAYRDQGQVRSNAVSLPTDFSRASFVAGDDLLEPKPDQLAREGLMQTYPLIRGCYLDCRFCGGSKFAYAHGQFRQEPSALGLEHFRRCLDEMAAQGARVLRISGDTRAFGDQYDAELRRAISTAGTPFDGALEVFTLPTRDYLAAWKEVLQTFVLIFSPESTFADLRRVHGKPYSNDDILRLAEWCRELGITLVFCLAYALPGHTRERILGELEFFEEILRRHPETSMMFQPYLYVDPGSEMHQHPERFGAKIHFRTLKDIVTALTRPYWYYAIGYELDGLSRDEFYEVILEVSRRKAAIYHRHRRLSAVNLAKTYENIAFQRQIYDFIRHDAPTDEELQEFIQNHLPLYLRRSNTSLVQRPFTGYIVQTQYDLDAALFDAFPLALELLVRFAVLPLEEYVERVQAQRRLCRPDEFDLLQFRQAAIDFFQECIQGQGVTMPFLRDLVAFEWLVYAYYYHPTAPNPARTVLSSGFNFDSLDGCLTAVEQRGTCLLLDSCPTQYTFTPDELISESGPRRRRLNVLSRMTFRLEPAVKKVVKSQRGIDCDLEYEEC